MNLFITLLAFVFTIGILVTIHELGHYWVARWCNVKVLRFSVGFGRPLLLWRSGPDRTEWVIAAIPLGGYVKMADESEEEVAWADRARAFNNKTVWQRIAIVLAGPLANFLLAMLLYWGLFVAGVPGMRPVIAQPPAHTVAGSSGYGAQDLILKIDNQPVQTWNEMRWILLKAAVNRATLQVEVEDKQGVRRVLPLSLEGVEADDLDQGFLKKIGLMPYRPQHDAVVGEVMEESAASRAGIVPGDKIIEIDGKKVGGWDELVGHIRTQPGRTFTLMLQRNGQVLQLAVTADPVMEKGVAVGRIGIQPSTVNMERFFTTVRMGPLEAAGEAVIKVWDMSIFSLRMMGKMVTGQLSWKNMSGAITIADYAGQSAQLGWIPYVTFLALVSVSLGVLNLLPVPVLDGGRLMYYIVEIFKGRPISDQAMEIGHQIGLTLLIGLSALAFYNDISRLLIG